MRWVFIALLGVHAMIHLIGVVKGFGLAEVTQLTQPISRSQGLLWLAAAALLTATAVLLAMGRPTWWMVGLAGVAVSQTAVLTAWTDARAGTLANIVVLVGVIYGAITSGGSSAAGS